MIIVLCIAEYVAATFGRNGVSPSYAEFAVPDSISDDLASRITVSFLVRTRKQSGLIFFIGANESSDASNWTFVTIELSALGVVSRVKLGNEIQRKVFAGLVADGIQHFVYVSLNYSVLQIQLDSVSDVYAVNYSAPLVTDLLYVAGMPLKKTRRRRDVYSGTADQFSGTLQDFRLNGIRLQTFPLTDEDGKPTTAPGVVLPIQVVDADRGEQSDDMCLQERCENNGTCYTEFFSQYRSLISLSAFSTFLN